jgi:hypothetical protein
MTDRSSETQLTMNGTCQWGEYERFHRVSEERWRKALSSERQGWQRQMRLRYPFWRLLHPFHTAPFGDDWNNWWAERFDNYAGLPAQVDALFEFGCGPYTNARIILTKVKAARVYLSDPLMPTYLTFRGTWLAREYNRRTVICDSSPLEKSPFSPRAGDIVVLINVLDHVQDGFLALRNALQVVKVGGWFIFGQDLTEYSGPQSLDQAIS